MTATDAVIEAARAVPAGDHVIYTARDETGQALYVGLTTNLVRRLLQHRRTSEWWLRVATVEHVATTGGTWALVNESVHINAERPLFNRTAGGRTPRAPRYSARKARQQQAP